MTMLYFEILGILKSTRGDWVITIKRVPGVVAPHLGGKEPTTRWRFRAKGKGDRHHSRESANTTALGKKTRRGVIISKPMSRSKGGKTTKAPAPSS